MQERSCGTFAKLVVIGPAGNSLVAGSEGRTAQTKPQQLLDGVDWALKQDTSQGSEHFHKIDTAKIAVMGQSCGTGQAISVSGDPRVTTTVLLNGGGSSAARAPEPPAGQTNAAPTPRCGSTSSSAQCNILKDQ